MKVLITLLFALALSTTISAQGEATSSSSSAAFLNTGGLFFGGTLSFIASGEKNFNSNGSTDGPKTSSFSILPQTAYILNRMLAVGIALGYVSNAIKRVEDVSGETFDLKDSRGEFVIQPQLAYYVQVMSRLYIFATLYVGLGFGNDTNQYVDFNNDTGQFERVSDKRKLSSIQAGIRFSFMYFIAAQWALTLAYGDLYYRSSTVKDPNDSNIKQTNNSYGLDLSLATVSIGILYYIAGQGVK